MISRSFRMTSIEQYRAAIGRFYGRASHIPQLKITLMDKLAATKPMLEFVNETAQKCLDNSGLSLQMTMRAAQVIRTLLAIGNVEKNPGPGDGKIVDLLKMNKIPNYEK